MSLAILQSINALGTLILAGIAVLAILVPLAYDYYRRPRFQIELRGIKYDEENERSPELRLMISNTGRGVAHGCKVLVDIIANDNKRVDSLYLPWVWEDPSKVSSKTVKDEMPYDENKNVTYVPITLYPLETGDTKFLFYAETEAGDISSSVLAVFGAYNSWHYYPKVEKRYIVVPPLSEPHPIFTLPEAGEHTSLKRNTLYLVKVTVFSEERSYRNLERIYFMFEDSGGKAGFSAKRLDIEF